ncbi:hypothetical protein OAM40_00550 [Gammaproteobacteria bacterium]|nr:hypothetical protein [Gammaproteobacteria bacterium]
MLEACFIRVEVKKRELISRTDLAIEMVRKGVPVILGEVLSANELEKIGVSKGYMFGKCAQPQTLSHFRPLLDRGWAFGALDEEGLLPVNLERFAKYRFSMESAEVFDDVFFFGEAQKNIFEDIYGTNDSFVVSGNPRTDMWQANCYDIHQETMGKIKESYGDFILIPLNFSLYTNKERNTVLSDDHLKYKQSIAKNSEILFDSFCKLAERLAIEADINVVMRPHPADDPDTVKDLMFKHGVRSDRVSCIGTNEVFPWISASKLVIHNCCTTSLEAGFLGTPVVTYAPYGIFLLEDDKDGLHQHINKLFPVAASPDDIINILVMNQNFNSEEFHLQISNWKRLNLNHSGNISAFIANRILERHAFSPRFDKLRLSSRRDFKRIKNEIVSRASSVLGNTQRSVFLHKFPRTSAQEVETIVHNICKYRGYHNRPKVIAINSRLFGLLPDDS